MNSIFTDTQLSAELLFQMIGDTEPGSPQEANCLVMLRQHPFFRLWGMEEFARKTDAWYKGTVEAEIGRFFTPEVFSVFQTEFIRSLKRIKGKSREYIEAKIKFLAGIKEISNLGLEAIGEVLGQDCFDFFAGIRSGFIEGLFPRQLTVVLSYQCNRSCDFCFSGELEKNDPGRIDRTFFSRVLDWLEGKGFKNISLFGGEPTIHPEFIEFAGELNRRGYGVYFATNGLYSQKVSKALQDVDFLKATFNIPAKGTLSDGEAGRLEANLNAFPSHIKKAFRITLADTNRDLTFLKYLTEKYSPEYLSYALAFPSSEKGNCFVATDGVYGFFEDMKNITKIGMENNVPCGLVKPIPLCRFSSDELLSLLNPSDLFGVCDIYQDNCLQLVSLSPSGRFYPCISLPEQQICHLDQNPSLARLRKSNKQLIQTLRQTPVLEECGRCNLYNARICQGFCYSYYI